MGMGWGDGWVMGRVGFGEGWASGLRARLGVLRWGWAEGWTG